MFRGFLIHRNHNYNPKLPQKLGTELDTAMAEALMNATPSEEAPNLTGHKCQEFHEERRQRRERLLKRQRLAFSDDWASLHIRFPYESDFQ